MSGMIQTASGLDGTKNTEMVIESGQIYAEPGSLGTIDKVQSLQINSEATLNPGTGIKCSLGLCCENTKIMLSKEMSAEDICYIQQVELTRAKEYLLQNKADDTIIRYSAQFNQVSSDGQFSPDKMHDNDLQSETQHNLGHKFNSQHSLDPINGMLSEEPSRKDIAVGQSTQLVEASSINVDSNVNLKDQKSLHVSPDISAAGSIIKLDEGNTHMV